jgi:small subunit ribosomal protein S13
MKINKIKNIKGIGSSTLHDIRSLFGINIKNVTQFDLSYNGILRIKKYLRIQKTGSLLQTLIRKRINNFISIKSYKGLRHKNGYPIHGQRTHTNAKTQRKLSAVRLN